MNSKFHKEQAEALIKQINAGGLGPIKKDDLLDLALIHATLANVADEED